MRSDLFGVALAVIMMYGGYTQLLTGDNTMMTNANVFLHVSLSRLNLSRTDLLVLIAIAAHADENGTACPLISTLSETMDVPERSVMRALSRLENKGLISRKKNGIRNVYTIAPAPDVENRYIVEVVKNV